MENKPVSNQDTLKKETEPAAPPGGDHITVNGSVGSVAVIGRGSIQIDNYAGGDMTINGVVAKNAGEFADLLGELQALIHKAQESGELDESATQSVMDNIQSAVEMAKSGQKSLKSKIIQKLQTVSDIIDAAVDTFTADGKVASTLFRTLPFLALLIKLAARIF